MGADTGIRAVTLKRKRGEKRRRRTRQTLRPEASSVCLQYTLRDVEAQAQSRHAGAVRRARAREAVEQSRQLIGCDPVATVGHGDPDLVGARLQRDDDAGMLVAVLD